MTIAVIMLVSTLAVAVGGLIYFARLAVTHADARAQLEREAATARGDSAVDAVKVDQANAATLQVDAARRAAQDRQHVAETTLGEQVRDAALTGDGDELLSASLAATPADSAGGSGEGDHGERGVPVRGSNGPPTAR
jgi:hypothetical protein